MLRNRHLMLLLPCLIFVSFTKDLMKVREDEEEQNESDKYNHYVEDNLRSTRVGQERDEANLSPTELMTEADNHFSRTGRRVLTALDMASSESPPLAEAAETTSKPSSDFFMNTPKFNSHVRDTYSGMWWQSVDRFVNENDFSRMKGREEGTFIALRNGGRIRMTKDWFDLSVEHLSPYWKHMLRLPKTYELHDEWILYNRTAFILDGFLERTTMMDVPNPSPTTSTIALLPFFVPQNENERLLVLKGLQATMMSLWRIGVPRSVVPGWASHREYTEAAFRELRALMSKHGDRPMEMVFVETEQLANVPGLALNGLKSALQHSNMPDSALWLGPTPSAWRYVYYAEPDLILHTRPSALTHLGDAMDRGEILAAHRLSLLPHEHNFPGVGRQFVGRLIPSVGEFSSVREMDPSTMDACCDGGDYYPANVEDTKNKGKANKNWGRCHPWHNCGLLDVGRAGSSGSKDQHDPNGDVTHRHKRLAEYPVLTIKTGTGIPFVSQHQRICYPVRYGNC